MHLITSAKITMADVRFVENTSPPKLLTCSYVCQAVPALTTMEEWSPNMKGGSTVDIVKNIKVVIIFWVVLELSKLSILSIIIDSFSCGNFLLKFAWQLLCTIYFDEIIFVHFPFSLLKSAPMMTIMTIVLKIWKFNSAADPRKMRGPVVFCF